MALQKRDEDDEEEEKWNSTEFHLFLSLSLSSRIETRNNALLHDSKIMGIREVVVNYENDTSLVAMLTELRKFIVCRR